MYMSKPKTKTSEHLKESLLMAGSLRLSGNQFHIVGTATEKTTDHNCWDDGEAWWEDLGWQSEAVVMGR